MSAHNAALSLVGRVLDGKYRIDALLGQGGFGAVFRATHLMLDHPCAIKVLHSSMLADPSAILRFQREARATVRISHPNAIAVKDFGVTPDQIVYLVMEYFDGISLRELIRRTGPIPLARAAHIVRCVAGGLHTAHLQGIIHRDVKPDNIMVRPVPGGPEEVKVLDFGIAKIVDSAPGASSLTQTGSIIGTPHYYSPDQVRGAELDARSDLYSLGIVAYEMLTGSVPFDAPTPIAVAMKHLSEVPPDLASRVLGLPPGVEAVLRKALAKRPEDRYPSTVAFAEEFSAAARVTTGSQPALDPNQTRVGMSAGLQSSTLSETLDVDPPRQTPAYVQYEPTIDMPLGTAGLQHGYGQGAPPAPAAYTHSATTPLPPEGTAHLVEPHPGQTQMRPAVSRPLAPPPVVAPRPQPEASRVPEPAPERAPAFASQPESGGFPKWVLAAAGVAVLFGVAALVGYQTGMFETATAESGSAPAASSGTSAGAPAAAPKPAAPLVALMAMQLDLATVTGSKRLVGDVGRPVAVGSDEGVQFVLTPAVDGYVYIVATSAGGVLTMLTSAADPDYNIASNAVKKGTEFKFPGKTRHFAVEEKTVFTVLVSPRRLDGPQFLAGERSKKLSSEERSQWEALRSSAVLADLAPDTAAAFATVKGPDPAVAKQITAVDVTMAPK